MTASTPLTFLTERPLAPAPGCDCSICPFYIHNAQAVEPICSGCNTDCAYCGCAKPQSGSPDACAQCPIRCGSRVDIADWMTDVAGTLQFDDIDFDDLSLPAGLPAYVPQVDTTELGNLDGGLHWPAYAMRLRGVFSPITHSIVPGFTDTTARAAMGLADDQLTVLVGYGEDPLVEAFWTRRFELTDQLVTQEWDLVLAPNFSMYGNFPRAELLLNFRRNLLMARDLIDAGVPAVPNVYWYRLEDLERYEELLAQVTPAAVAINLQTFRTDRAWDEMAIPGLAYLASGFPAETTLIVTGTSRASRLRQLKGLFPSLVLVSQNATIYARKHAVMTDDGRQGRPTATVGECFVENVHFYAEVIS